MKKRLLLLALILLPVLGLLGARLYLSSSRVAVRIANRVCEVLGAPVELDRASVGLFGDSTFQGLRVQAVGGGSGAAPWLRIGAGEVDLSALDLLRGGSPK